MKALGIYLPQPSLSELERLYKAAKTATPNYGFVGATLSAGARPSEKRRSVALGEGDAIFDRAVEGLRRWLPQRNLDALVYPDDVPIAEGETVLVVLRLGPLAVVAPDRIVAVVDEPDRFGFAYGTLPGHAEQGEESFLIERDADGEVRFTIGVDAVPATIPARLVAPVVRRIQSWALTRYLEAIKTHSSPDGAG